MADSGDFTSFLFGNVDEEGNLEGDFLDEETKAQLSNLTYFLNSSAAGAAAFEGETEGDPEDQLGHGSGSETGHDSSRPESKASSAEDFAEISELAGDDEQNGHEQDQMDGGSISEAIIPLDRDRDANDSSDDSEVYVEDAGISNGGSEPDLSEEGEMFMDGEIEKPLASMLPAGFRDTDVRLYFPEFREGKTLRFSRLFGPGKPNSLPQIWRSVKSRRKPTTTESSQQQRKSADDVEKSTLETAVAIVDESHHGFELEFAPPPPIDQCEADDELLLMKPEDPSKKAAKSGSNQNDDKNDFGSVAPWRFGPAAYWYDLMGVPADGEGFDYGLKSKAEKSETIDDHDQKSEDRKQEDMFPSDAYLPITCSRWEDDVVFDGEEIREAMLAKLTSGRQPICGWIPTQQTRTYESFIAMLKNGGFAQIFGAKSSQQTPVKPQPPAPSLSLDTSDPGPNFCIFPPDNEELISGRWLHDVIIDPEKMDRIPEPAILTLDPSEDQMLFGIPEDVAKEQELSMMQDDNALNKTSDRKEHQFTKKSQMILGKVAQRQREEEEEAASQMVEKDAYNLSNDEYYLPKGTSTVSTFGGSMIQHSIPAQNLMRPFFPTYLSTAKLRHFHRWPLKRFSGRSQFSKPGYHSVQSLEKHIQKKERLREQLRLASGGGEMFFMRESEDLSGKDGELIFCEYSEEHPPLLMQPGMATKIKNFYKRKPGKDNAEPRYDFGETAYTHTLPFLGTLAPGESLQALENSLYRAPIYQHRTPETDFLIIRTRHGYYVRSVPTIFCVGQECPCYEVPSPNSKRASNFVRDYLLVFIYRLFWESKDEPRRIRMEDIRQNAFPHYAESTIRKRLKLCSDFKRLGPGTEANFWVLRDDFRLPSKEEIRAMVTPESCCAFFSMLAAEQRLKDAGYGEKYFFTPEDEDDDNDQAKMADEIKCAPWNTTRAFISAMKGKCLLDLTGVADPTGTGEGFSYVRVSAKPPKEELPPPVKRTVTGTDADLRKLSLKDAKQLLRDFGVKDDEIKTLTRWEIIDVIRTLSTQQARAGGTGITKFARGSMRFSMAEVQERYKQDCQRIFELQNKVLKTTDIFSTDEEESEAEDSDIEEMGKNIETMLTSKRTAAAAAASSEEKELREFQLSLQQSSQAPTPSTAPTTGQRKKDKSTKSKDGAVDDKKVEMDTGRATHSTMAAGTGPRKLKIFRTFRLPDGREHVRSEVVTRPELIEAYVRIRQTKDEAFIKHFAQMDEQYKEEKRREKRRLQDQLRRIRRNEIKMQLQDGGSVESRLFGTSTKFKSEKSKKPPPPPKPSLMKMRCSACGGTGHMKTNKTCPVYGKIKLPPTQVALTDEQIEEEMQLPTSTENLVSVEGTKLKLSKVVVEHAEKMKKKSLKLKFPKNVVTSSMLFSAQQSTSASAAFLVDDSFSDDQRYSVSPSTNFDDSNPEDGQGESRPSLVMKITNPELMKKKRQHAEYLKDVPKASVNRRRVDPRVAMSVALESILNELKSLPESGHFLHSVNKKKVPDYYRIVERPMDLQKIRMQISKNHYVTREEFLKDVRQMLDNSRLYNGDQNEITQAARVLFEHASRRVAEKEQRLMKLEKAINPLLDDNDQVAFSYILENTIEKCRSIPKSFLFHAPVDPRKVKTYYERIRRPMDLGTMEQKCKRNMYHTVAAFERDLALIYNNSALFNGETSSYTVKAKEIYDVGKKELDERRQQLADLEKSLRATKEKALEDAETDSLVTGTSSVAGDGVNEPRMDESPISLIRAPDENSNSVLLQQDLQLSEGEDDEVFRKSSTTAGPIDFSQLHEESTRPKPQSTTSLPKLEREELEEGELVEESTSAGPTRMAPDDDEEDDDESSRVWKANLAEMLDQSDMNRTGRLHTDLAMSDSSGSDQDDDDERGDDGPSAAKRVKTYSGDDCDFGTL